MKKLDWNHLQTFHATASAGSLSAAARQLGLSQPTLSRQVQALENALSVILFDRVGRRLVLTQTGRELLGHISTMKDAAESVTLTASGRIMEISGRVTISATDTIASYILPEMLKRLRLEAPQLTIEVIATNDISNLHQSEADIAIRHARPDRKGLVGQNIRNTEAYFYASEDWVSRNGLPASMADLAKSGLLGFGDIEGLAHHFQKTGISIEASDFRLVSGSAVVIWEMVKSGLGVAAMLTEIARQTKGVVKLLPDSPPIKVPLWLVTHSEIQSSPRIRLVQEILTEEFCR